MRLTNWRILSILLALSMLAAPVQAETPRLPAASAATAVYIVLLTDAPLALYDGGVPGLAATNPATLGQRKLDPNSAASLAYRAYLAERQTAVLQQMSLAFGRSVQAIFRYDAVLNGFSVELSAAEAAAAAALPGVSRVVADERLDLLTDAGPAWINAPQMWNGSATGGGPGTQGEGIVVGIIDTGINHDHPSFADVGGDGYNHTNPRPTFFGVCLAAPVLCNDKLIGMYDYTGTSPLDDNGHGSHTASTAAGNHLTAVYRAPTRELTHSISGVAPHANIIAYKTCLTTPVPGCFIHQTLAAINQATLDMVDVINYSISGGVDPYSDVVSQAFLSARNAGVFVSASAGNDGPGPNTTAHNDPWTLTVAASTHNRKYVNGLVDLAGGSSASPGNLSGAGVTSGYGPAPIVYAGAAPYNDPLCEDATPGKYSGQIVVCDRGVIGRVMKSENVAAAGAGGFVLAKDEANGDSLVGDAFALPGVHITYANGVALKAWLASGSGHAGRITGAVLSTDAANGDIMASFSSRGPSSTLPDVLKPDVTAPGVDILAAVHSTIPAGPHAEFGFLSGTSMSSPHAAGAAALMVAAHPDWTPAEIQSALMATAFTSPRGGTPVHGVLDTGGTQPADAFDMGAGRIDLSLAAQAGLVLHETGANYAAANPVMGGDPTTLNLASLADASCAGTCTWTRVVRSTLNTTKTWHAATSAPGRMALRVRPSSFTLAPGQSVTLTVTADVSRLAPDAWYLANFRLVASGVPQARFPVAAYAVGEPGSDERLVLHFQGNLEEGCSGDGLADVLLCDGPFLTESSALDSGPAAAWTIADPLLTDNVARSLTDPNWVWHLDQPTTLDGKMSVEWWASCGTCNGILTADWFIRVWADDELVVEQRITATPLLPNVPQKLAASVIVPAVTAEESIVLHVSPVYIDSQVATRIYYDSAQPCVPTGTEPCDSLVAMPVVGDDTGKPKLSIRAEGPAGEVRRGETVSYKLIARNSGSGTATAVVIASEVPQWTTFVSCAGGSSCGLTENNYVEWNVPSLAPGETVIVTLKVRVNENTPDGAMVAIQSYEVDSAQTQPVAGSGEILSPLTHWKLFLAVISRRTP